MWVPVASAQSLVVTIPPEVRLTENQPVAAAMHPAAKGALIGGAAGLATMGVLAYVFCVQGPGECSKENFRRAIPIYAGVGAGIGAVIGALRR